MRQQMKSCFVIASVLLVLVPVSADNVESNESSGLLTSDSVDGLWVNSTLEIFGSTNFNPQTADWVLYDVTNPYVEWPVLRSGDFFTTVTPIEEGLWNWTLMIDVQGINCTCWLEIGQPNGLGKEFLNRIIFVGAGPHNPVISPIHESTIMLDEPVIITAIATLSDSIPSDGSIVMSWCSSPNGACDGESFSETMQVEWNGNKASFELNATDMDLDDGVWSFTYSYQDVFLRESPAIEITVYVDRNAPVSSMISPSESNEGDSILIDGSGSSDGVWTNNIQYVWYVTKPDGSVFVPATSEDNSILEIMLNESGLHTIRLDVIDWVGRMNSTTSQINVLNSVPVLSMSIEGTDVINPNSWQFSLGDNISLQPNITDSGDTVEEFTFSWYLDSKLVSNSQDFSIAELDEGTYILSLIVTDDDGANDSYEIEIMIASENEKINDKSNYGSVVVMLGIIGFSILIFSRIKNKDSESKSLPKWNEITTKTEQDVKQVNSHESELWD
ncbi:MAG: hypothetical protein ACPG73_01485 [Candidatus Poseidoniaceae archaeon]